MQQHAGCAACGHVCSSMRTRMQQHADTYAAACWLRSMRTRMQQHADTYAAQHASCAECGHVCNSMRTRMQQHAGCAVCGHVCSSMRTRMQQHADTYTAACGHVCSSMLAAQHPLSDSTYVCSYTPSLPLHTCCCIRVRMLLTTSIRVCPHTAAQLLPRPACLQFTCFTSYFLFLDFFFLTWTCVLMLQNSCLPDPLTCNLLALLVQKYKY